MFRENRLKKTGESVLMRYLLIWLSLSGFLRATDNSEILTYLGEPILYKSDKIEYQSDVLKEKFKKACGLLGVELLSIGVDESEYPPLLFGKTSPLKSVPQDLKRLCEKMGQGYVYAGSVSSSEYFCVDVMPMRVHPQELVEKIHRRQIRKSIVFEKLESTFVEEVNIHVATNPAYRSAKVLKAFKEASFKAGVEILGLAMDDSIDPPLIYGKLAIEGNALDYLKAVCYHLADDYVYSGSSSSNEYFSLSVIPNKVYPSLYVGDRMRNRFTKVLEKAKQEF